MEFEDCGLVAEVNDVMSSSANPVHFYWMAYIHVMQTGEDIQVMKVTDVDVVSDFEQNFTDETWVEVALTMGVYANRIYPYQDNLEISLVKYPLQEVGDVSNQDQPVQVKRYQATLMDTGDPMIQGMASNLNTQSQLDLTNFQTFKFFLFDKSLEQIRMMTVGQIVRNCTVEDTVKTILSKYSAAIDLDDADKVTGVDMVTASNQNVMNHIVIPQGTRLTDVPQYIHDNCGGIYSSGLGTYLRDRTWYVYPLLDTQRLATAVKTAIIVVIPPKKFVGIERTFKIAGDNVTILAGGDIQFRGDSTPQQLSHGNGVRFADASKMIGGFVKTENNMSVAARGNINNEFISVARPNGLNNVQTAGNSITANPFAAASKLARRNGSIVAFGWDNSDDSLLVPGMMATILYLAGDTIRTLQGVLLKAHTHVRMSGQGMTNGRHISHTAMSFFVQNLTS
jgi:hypothetical protein